MSKGRDLGTYFVRIKFDTGGGFIMRWNTQCALSRRRYGHGKVVATRSEATGTVLRERRRPVPRSEFQFTDGNYSCDCDLRSFLDRAYSRERDEKEPDYECGDTIKLKRITAIRPDGSEHVLFTSEASCAG